ncbi:response regulator [Ruminococcaceae bacterium OttesenSCG-928-D13]|nr:response regulator [Ruminococcaceae bacterium OttesenSCG-928-D13]
MIKIMIVDDEASIRKGLKHYIDWSAWDIQLVAEAGTAEEAEPKAIEARPDILICDIRMPGEDGLTLCRKLRRVLPDLQILLLTGYDDKDYLWAALEIGVKDYLLKPAGADTIITSVLKMKDEIMAQRQKERQYIEQKSLLDENFTIIQMYFVTEMLSGCSTDTDKLRAKAKTLDIPLDGPFYLAMKVRFFSIGADYTTEHELYQNYWRLLQTINGVNQQVEDSFFCELEPQEYFLLVNGGSPAQVTQKAEVLARMLVDETAQKNGQRVLAALGGVAAASAEIGRAYQDAGLALEASAWDATRQIFTSEDLPKNEEAHAAEAEQLVRLYNTRLSEGQTQAALEVFGQLAAHLRGAMLRLGLVREYARQLLTFSVHLSRQESQSAALRDHLLHLEAFYSGDELLDWLQSQLEGLLCHSSGALPTYSPIVQKAVAHMRTAYRQDITLQSLAKALFISPNYLGRIFRQETGFKMNEWLNRYRIDHAKELLMDPAERTADVAEKVGFNSYKYFSICFQKFAGSSLGDWRKEHTRKISG